MLIYAEWQVRSEADISIFEHIMLPISTGQHKVVQRVLASKLWLLAFAWVIN